MGVGALAARSNFHTLEYQHKPECPLHELEEY